MRLSKSSVKVVRHSTGLWKAVEKATGGLKPSSLRAGYAALKRRSSTVLLAALNVPETSVKIKGDG